MTKVVTGVARLSYTSVFEAKAMDGAEPKYSTAVLIPKTDKKTIKAINEAIEEAKELGKANKWNGKVPGNCKTPLRDGDDEREDDPVYAGHYFFNASAKTKPGVVKVSGRNKDGRPEFEHITDSTEVYSGCYAKVSINFFPFNTNGNKGIAVGLNNICKVKDGEFLGGRATAEDDFSDEVDFSVGDEDIEDYL